jgi:hypothetical protein
MKMHKDRLTERQRLFCEHYVGTGGHCAALAARLAGYAHGCSHVTGCQLLKKPKIAATVKWLEEAVAREIGVTRQRFLFELQEAAALAKEKRDPAALIAAWREIGKASGFYSPEVKKVDLNLPGQVAMVRMNALSDAELLRIISQGNPASH